MNASVATILDRLHAINERLTGVHAYRYWLQDEDTAKMPRIIPLPREATRLRRTETQRQITRRFILDVACGHMNQGIPVQSAQERYEAVSDALDAAYDPRDRLQLDDVDDVLIGVISAQLGDDTGLIDREGVAVAQFDLNVVYIRTVTLK